MKLETKLKKLSNGDIEVVKVDPSLESVEVLLPYESSSVDIELEGETDIERIESFKIGVNRRLNEMINHLEDCKFDDKD
jgi:hypothetical protein